MNIDVLAIMVPVIIGLVGSLKNVGMPSSFSPFVAIVLGYVLVGLFSHAWGSATVLVGLMTGLSAVGLYAGTASTVPAVAGLFKKTPSV